MAPEDPVKSALRPVLCAAVAVLASLPLQAGQAVTRYVRYSTGGGPAYGILENDSIRELKGDIFTNASPTGRTLKLAAVKLLPPCAPSKVIAVGLNYKSHLGERPAAEYPGLFAKYPSSLIAHEENIVIPPDAKNVHYEGELVVVIGRRARNVSVKDAKSHVFGVTIGNDVSERDWQKQDLQWFRAKATDTFGPMGPAIVTGVNYDDLLLETRLNGQVVQSQRTKDLIFDVATIVSYLSRYVTLEPGDVIFTGTPGTTRAFKAGDVIEVEIESVGTLRNRAIQGAQ
jgi:2-keto-4-pentenoate hydratase/2-oxohepta-3-ene-1,7-dioic acid hydratase in catechol pathway